MRILVTVLACDVILGAAMALYLVVIWRKYKGAIAEHGWNTDCADPICGNMWLVCFIPLLGIAYYLVTGEAVGRLATTYKEDVGGVLTIRYGKLAIHYDEGK